MSGQESTPRLADLDEGWSEEEEDELDSAWGDEEEEEELAAAAPGAPPRERKPKKVRPKRAPREIRAERLRALEQRKADTRLEKDRTAAAKQKVKQPKEKKPKGEGPSKREQRKAKQSDVAALHVARFSEAPDLARDEAAARRRGGSLQDARLAKKAKAGLPPYVAYLVLGLLLGGALLFLLLR